MNKETYQRRRQELLNQIDHEVEVVPLEDKNRLSRLLVSLKGQDLSDVENRMIERIVKKELMNWKKKKFPIVSFGDTHSRLQRMKDGTRVFQNEGLLRKWLVVPADNEVRIEWNVVL